VWVRCPTVSAGYWNKPAETAETFVDGWCRTGDLGRVTPDGYLVLTGRAKDMIRSGGENIYPAEVEAVLTTHPSVAEAAVVAVPHPGYLEVGCAVVVLTEGWTLDRGALDAHCRAHLAAYKVPKHFLALESLPRNASGKVLKHVLRDRYRAIREEVAAGAATSAR
jgi:fatty-acyl-CoA synthase